MLWEWFSRTTPRIDRNIGDSIRLYISPPHPINCASLIFHEHNMAQRFTVRHRGSPTMDH